jgi:hypothetical protein
VLAAPTLATLRVLGRYVVSRLYDRDPFAQPFVEKERETPRPKPTVVKKVGEAALKRLQEKVRQAAQQYAESSDSSSTSER